jgi:hypothetical protein
MCYGMMQSYKCILHCKDIVLGCRDVVTKASVTVICNHCIFGAVGILCSVRSFDNCGDNVIQSVSSSRR